MSLFVMVYFKFSIYIKYHIKEKICWVTKCLTYLAYLSLCSSDRNAIFHCLFCHHITEHFVERLVCAGSLGSHGQPLGLGAAPIPQMRKLQPRNGRALAWRWAALSREKGARI